MILFIIVGLAIVIIPAALLLKKARKTRSEEEDHARRQRLDYQPAIKPIPVATPVLKPVQKQRPAAPLPEVDVLKNCQDLRQCLVVLAEKYSLDSFTIATSDGLVFASSGGTTAQEDAASYSGKYTGETPVNVVLFTLNHKGSELTGIIRTREIITAEMQTPIEDDTKDILDKWI